MPKDRRLARIEAQGFDQVIITYCAASIAMWEALGWRKKRILGVLEETADAWHECAGSDKSMVQMLDEETGVELQIGNGKSWKELGYLNGEAYADMCRNMTQKKMLYVQARQLQWIPAQVIACMFLGLHRKQGFGAERLERLYGQMEDVKAAHRGKRKALQKHCLELTGINVGKHANGDIFIDGRKEDV